MNASPDLAGTAAVADPEHARRRLAIQGRYETFAAAGGFDIFGGKGTAPQWFGRLYTTTGVEGSGVDVRFNRPPEVTLHRLERV